MEPQGIKNRKLLLIDDEPELLNLVQGILEEDGYHNIKTAPTAKEGLSLWQSWQPELAVLDVMLPDGDGFTLLAQARRFSDIPVLFLTARGEDEDRCRGLGMGADDYMVKPFLPKELTLRIGGLLRRCYKSQPALVHLAACELDFERAEVIKGTQRIPLTAKEFEILQALCRNAGKIVTIDQLCQAAWGDNPFGYENSLMAHIRRIREKIEANPSKPVSLITVKGLGYRLNTEDVK